MSLHTATTLIQPDQSAADRCKGCEILGELGSPAAVDLLLATLNTDDPKVFQAAADALVKTGAPEATAAFRQVLEQEDPWGIRHRIAITALGQRRDAAAAPDLLRMTHPDYWYSIREAAVLALGNTPDPSVADPLIALLEDEEYAIQCAAAKALGVQQVTAAVPALCEKLEAQDQWGLLQGAILEALAAINSLDAVETLVNQLKYPHNPRVVRDGIIDTLTTLGPASVPHMLRVLPFVDPPTQQVISRGLYQLNEPVLCEVFPGALNAKPRSLAQLLSRAAVGDIRALSTLVARIKQLRAPSSTTESFIKDALKTTVNQATLAANHSFVCTKDFAQFTRFSIENTPYLACRQCGETYYAQQVSKVELTLHDAAPLQSLDSDGTLVVNWLLHQQMIDCDEVSIGSADNEAVVRFCMMAGNDADPFRGNTRLPCTIQSTDQLDHNTLQILRKTFTI